MDITENIGPTISPIIDSAKKNERKAAEVVQVEISNGIDNNFYPRPQIYTLGLNFVF